MLNVTSLYEEKLALGSGGMEIMECGNLDWVAVKVPAYWQGPELLNCHLWGSTCPSCMPYDWGVSYIAFTYHQIELKNHKPSCKMEKLANYQSRERIWKNIHF